MSIVLYRCITRTLTKRTEKNLNGSCSRMLRAVLNIFWKQHPTKRQFYGHVSPISKKQSKLDEQGMQHTGGEARTKSSVTISYGPLHMDVSVLADQGEHTTALFEHRVLTRRPAWMIWTIGEREREYEKSVPAA